jgi:hypothetical protein
MWNSLTCTPTRTLCRTKIVNLIGRSDQELSDKIRSHLCRSKRAKNSESFAASTGSRHNAERSVDLSHREAVGSVRTSSMLGCLSCSELKVSPSDSPDSYRRDDRTEAVGFISALRKRWYYPRTEKMSVPTAEATYCGSDAGNCIFEGGWQGYPFASPVVEDWRHRATERCVLSPEFHLQVPPSAMEKNRTHQARSSIACRFCQRMPCHEQIIGSFNTQHFEPD